MSLPAEMRVVAATGLNELSDLVQPVPKPAAGEVLVKVAASGVNPIDFLTLSNVVPLGKPYPCTKGCDLAGTVAAIGEGVTEFKVGDEVFGMTGSIAQGPQGTLAEYAIAWEPMLAKKPANLTMREAAATPLALMTAWEGIMERPRIHATDHVLVTGASGSVGNICIQLALQRGAKVYGLASEGKRHLVEKYGAIFIDHTKGIEEVRRVAKEMTPHGRGFNVVYEVLGGNWLDHAFELVAPHGYVAELHGFVTQKLDAAAAKGITFSVIVVLVPFLFPEPESKKFYGDFLRSSVPLLESGKLKIEVDDHRFPFSKDGVAECYDSLAKNKNRGKYVIDIVPQ